MRNKTRQINWAQPNLHEIKVSVQGSNNTIPDSGAALETALGKVDLLTALGACMLSIEFIGKDLFYFPAVRALAAKRFEMFKLFISGTMLWCGHGDLPYAFMFTLETITSALLSFM